MPCVFNTMDHETEQISREAAGQLMDGLAALYTMLGQVERGNSQIAEGQRSEVIRLLEESSDRLQELAQNAGAYLLRVSSLEDPDGVELPRLYSQLEDFGYRLPLKNNDLPAIGAWETRALVDRVRTARFQGTKDDWFPVRDILRATERLLALGVIAARLSALHGHR